MRYEEQKRSFVTKLNHIKGKLHPIKHKEEIIREIELLENDILSEYYSIVTVGEFKNGKSTFINALLEEDIMPVGVTPTTATINVAKWGEERQVVAHMLNGHIEKKELTKEIMSQYIASEDFHPQEIDHLQLRLPASILKENVVLVDTPGVNDLNNLLPIITYQYIPRADVILFVLNSTTPVRRTEYEFLTETILSEGIDRIIFVANFMDLLEEEEIEEAMSSIKERLNKIPGLATVEVFPLSAVEALEGKLEQNEDLLEFSGLTAIEKKLNELLQSGSRSTQKIERYRFRIGKLIKNLLAEIEFEQAISQKSEQDLQQELEQLQNWENGQKDREELIKSYIQERKNEIYFMINKSIDYLFEKIEEEVEEQILLFTGSDIQHLVETRLPTLVKKRLKNWIEQYSNPIYGLLRQLEEKLSEGLSQSFQEQVKISSYTGYGIDFNSEFELENTKKKDPLVTSSLLMGGASTLAVILGAPLFLPIIGMVGLPFLQKTLLKKHLDEIKPQLIMETRKQLFHVKENFQKELGNYISSAIDEIKNQTIVEFKQKTNKFADAILAEKESKTQEKTKSQQTYQSLEQLKEEMTQLFQTLTNEEEPKDERLPEPIV